MIGGGGIAINESSTGTINNVDLISNNAIDGGAVAIFNTPGNIHFF